MPQSRLVDFALQLVLLIIHLLVIIFTRPQIQVPIGQNKMDQVKIHGKQSHPLRMDQYFLLLLTQDPFIKVKMQVLVGQKKLAQDLVLGHPLQCLQ